MRALVALGLLALASCDSKSTPAARSEESKRDAVEASPQAQAIPKLPGTIWLADQRVLVRIASGERHEMRLPDAGLFPSRFALPDGRLVAIASKGDGSADSEQLALVSPEGVISRIGPTAAMIRDPAVDPAGHWIVYAANPDGHSELYRLELATHEVTRLTENREGNFAPAILGDSLVLASSRDGDSEIYRLTGGKPQRLTAFHKDDWVPTPSPIGDQIAFLSDREGAVRIFLMAPDGTNQRRLTTRAPSAHRSGERAGTPDATDEVEPTWSRDGKQLAYVVEHARERTVIVRQLATGAERILSPPSVRDGEPSFSPDGTWLALAREKPAGVWAIRIADGHAVPVATGRLPRWH
ncbi:MAG: PD40 domain-containing protein [Deltaproteobacteria bacterium]|nr:PD40 domain-containing protein [Deltaproteobacteria bacterium]